MSLQPTPTPRRKPPVWTPADLQFAREHIGRRNWSYALVGKELRRTPEAVKIKLTRTGHRKPITGPTEKTLTQREVCAVLGITNHRTVQAWLKAKVLKGSRVPTASARTRGWAVFPADLVEFLQRHPERYDYDRLPVVWQGAPNPYRQHARRQSATTGHLALKQASKRLGIAGQTLRRWHTEGRLTLVRLVAADVHPNDWFMALPEVTRIERERVQLRNGWWTLPKGDK